MKLGAVTGIAIVTAATLAGCGGTPYISQDTLQNSVSSSLQKSVGTKPEKIECPDKVKAKANEATRCVLSHKGKKYGVAVRVKSVKGSKANFDIKVDDKPMS
ncbi:DUF4333 domain-containing protein [Kribbella deserti]|uniref:DUF4333 domain-containing protein n=1 Tax=Kribbella deserti TaxID=1926257 RepID=A0ABV6QTQ0_9ACTN